MHTRVRECLFIFCHNARIRLSLMMSLITNMVLAWISESSDATGCSTSGQIDESLINNKSICGKVADNDFRFSR